MTDKGPLQGDDPVLLGIGLSRAGSTWLAENLASQPWTVMPRVKDLYFFDRHYERGPDWYNSAFDVATNSERRIHVDVSHDYFHSPLVPGRIEATLGDRARCVLVLREPVAWVESQIRYGIQVGAAPRRDTGDLSPWLGTMASGFYDRLLRPWERLESNGQLLLVAFDDLVADGPATLRKVADHVGCGAAAINVAASAQRANGSALPRYPAASRLAREATQWLRRRGAVDLVGSLKSNRLARHVLFRSTDEEHLFAFSPAVREQLTDFYADSVLALDNHIPGIAARWGYGTTLDLSSPQPAANAELRDVC